MEDLQTLPLTSGVLYMPLFALEDVRILEPFSRHINPQLTRSTDLRQEENQYLAIPEDELKAKHDRKSQRLLGWSISEPYLGWIDFQDPLKRLYPEEFPKGPTDLTNGQNGDQ